MAVSGAGEDDYSQGTDGKLGLREEDLVFPRSHHLPREPRPAVAELSISQSHGVILFHLERRAGKLRSDYHN